MKILIFGIGAHYLRLESELDEYMTGDTLLGFVDNNAENRRNFAGHKVYLPQEAARLDFDLIVLASIHWQAMRAQLIELGVSRAKIMLDMRYIALKAGGKKTFYGAPLATAKRKIVLVAHDMYYDGGSLVAAYAVAAMRAREIDVLLLAPRFDPRLRRELLTKGAYLCEFPGMTYANDVDLLWLRDYDAALVNVFPNITLAVKLHKIIPTVWWLHECSEATTHIFSDYMARFPEFTAMEAIKPLNIYAVSNLAARAFAEFYPGCVRGLLPFGIPDERSFSTRNSEQITIAIIGNVQTRKGQIFFVDAYERVKTSATRALIIGNYKGDSYASVVRARAAEVGAELTGVLTREELAARFADIDIVVCPSLEETMSIAVIEGLMNGCICITSDNTGVADYIEDGKNGFICKTGDTDSLAAKMRYAIEHITEIGPMRVKARETYKQHFSMEAFGERLVGLLENIF